MLKVNATHEAGWGKIMVQGSQQSFKDEWLVALFSIPLNLSSCGKWATAIWLPHIELPKFQTEELMTLTLSLFGLAGLFAFKAIPCSATIVPCRQGFFGS